MARLLFSLLVAALALSDAVAATTSAGCDVRPDPPATPPAATPVATSTPTALASIVRVQATANSPSATPAMISARTPSVSPSPSPSPTPTSATPAPAVLSTGTTGLGACYEPMHSALYPLRAGDGGDSTRIGEVLDRDLAQLRDRFAVLRTYHAQYFGLRVADYASRHRLKLYVGLATYPGRADWDELELQAAVEGARAHPGTVEAIIVSSEDLAAGGGAQRVDAVLAKVEAVRARLAAAGVPAGSVLVGSAQRVNELLDGGAAADMDRLVAGCDFVGVNIYPFFTAGFDAADPVALLDAQWAQLRARFGTRVAKFRVTETGWPSTGGAPAAFPRNTPSAATQRAYFHAVADWRPHDLAGAHFWFMAYDRRADDAMAAAGGARYEQFFGVFTAENEDKGVL